MSRRPRIRFDELRRWFDLKYAINQQPHLMALDTEPGELHLIYINGTTKCVHRGPCGIPDGPEQADATAKMLGVLIENAANTGCTHTSGDLRDIT